MRKRRRTYEREFKESAVGLCRSGEKTIKSVAEELGICRTVLGQWVRASEKGEADGLKVFPGHGNPRDEELARLRKENADLREANEILKKATAIFAAIKPR